MLTREHPLKVAISFLSVQLSVFTLFIDTELSNVFECVILYLVRLFGKAMITIDACFDETSEQR